MKEHNLTLTTRQVEILLDLLERLKADEMKSLFDTIRSQTGVE